MTIGTFVDRIFIATASLLTWGTVLVSLVMVVVLSVIIYRRNHLTPARIRSNLAGYIVGATLWAIGGSLSIPANATSYQWIAYTFWLTLLVCLSILMASLWQRTKAGPFPILRGYTANGLLAVAAFIAPVEWATREQTRIDKIVRSVHTMRDVIGDTSLKNMVEGPVNNSKESTVAYEKKNLVDHSAGGTSKRRVST